MTDDLLKMRDSFGKDQALFLFNRRIMEHVFKGKIASFPEGNALQLLLSRNETR